MVWMYVALGGVGLILVLVGILLIFLRNKKKDRCVYKSTAKICDAKGYNGDAEERTMYHAVYEYEYGGKIYCDESTVGSSIKPKIGKKVTIYINPEKPKEYYMKSFAKSFTNILLTGLGVIFIVLAIVLYFVIGV